jgi:hypothetical protein
MKPQMDAEEDAGVPEYYRLRRVCPYFIRTAYSQILRQAERIFAAKTPRRQGAKSFNP